MGEVGVEKLWIDRFGPHAPDTFPKKSVTAVSEPIELEDGSVVKLMYSGTHKALNPDWLIRRRVHMSPQWLVALHEAKEPASVFSDTHQHRLGRLSLLDEDFIEFDDILSRLERSVGSHESATRVY